MISLVLEMRGIFKRIKQGNKDSYKALQQEMLYRRKKMKRAEAKRKFYAGHKGLKHLADKHTKDFTKQSQRHDSAFLTYSKGKPHKGHIVTGKAAKDLYGDGL